MWGVTVQNEPEAAVGWEACLWTPAYQAAFVRDHLGPVHPTSHCLLLTTYYLLLTAYYVLLLTMYY